MVQNIEFFLIYIAYKNYFLRNKKKGGNTGKMLVSKEDVPDLFFFKKTNWQVARLLH